MIFIRLSGCNLSCDFCDTEEKLTGEATVDEILDTLKAYELPYCRHVVITGGEPTIYDLRPLVAALRHDYSVHLETNGTNDLRTNLFSWVAVSPKTRRLWRPTMLIADEIKYLWSADPTADWAGLLWDVHTQYHINGRSFVMPLARNHEYDKQSAAGLIQENIDSAIEFCKQESTFSLCMQMHKVWGIP